MDRSAIGLDAGAFYGDLYAKPNGQGDGIMSWSGDRSTTFASRSEVAVESFVPSANGYTWNADRHAFEHVYSRDIQLFVIWAAARRYEEQITEMIATEFRVLARFEVRWSQERLVNNFERLYATGVGLGSGKEEDVGTGPFLLIVAEDADPVYQYRRNVSGFFEITSTRAARVKRAARELAGGYTVHSSNRLEEFFRDATLMLGPNRLDTVLARPISNDLPACDVLHDDLVGANGWRDLTEVIEVLRRATEYLALRGFTELPGSLSVDPEIDVLTRERLDFAAIVNAKGDPSGSAVRTVIDGSEVIFDVREVGDGYFDARWQDRMLQRRVVPGDAIAQPRPDDHFFSLLYHTKIQKTHVKPAHAGTLALLAEQLDLPVDIAAGITEDEVAAAALDGYLTGHRYIVPQPSDLDVERNATFTQALRMTPVEPSVAQVVRTYLWSRLRYSRMGSRAAESDRLRAVVRRMRGWRARGRAVHS
ncbi:hypothetical protein GCM10022240_00320 [Microbacterium kribbense]|uniref:Uncharacterized protein n=1 Tax=Microbacterium kribbense TaxID=433645 RepID=A0ABP7G3S2_9MICO